MREPWVVAYRIDTNEGDLIVEFYRGSRQECERIKANSAPKGDSDQGGTGWWKPVIGPAESWDEFVCEVAASEAIPLGAA